MKAAILISGHMRSFERCLPTLHWFIFRHFPGADFFCSTEPDADAPKAELLRAKYPDAKVSIDTTPQPPIDASNVAGFEAHAPYAISVPVAAVLGQLWRLERCWDFYTGIANSDAGPVADVVIRCRPDLWMESFTMPHLASKIRVAGKQESEIAGGPTLISYKCAETKVALTPWWGRFGGVNDRFALLGQHAAAHYFRTFGKISQLLRAGCPLHPESLIKASLEDGGCTIDDTLDVSFSTLRANGERRFPEIMAQDIAHFGGRT